MYVVRLNDVTIQIKGQNVFVLDVFGDMGKREVHVIVDYLVKEGFLTPDDEINVFVKSKPFLSIAPQKEDTAKD